MFTRKQQHIIVNTASKSGRGLKKWKELSAVLSMNYIPHTVYFTQNYPDTLAHIRSLTQTHAAEPFYLTILGGDGTVNEVLNGIENFDRIIINYLPTGSSNDFARALKLRDDAFTILTRIEFAPTNRIDIGTVTLPGTQATRRFAVSCGIGFDAAICEEVMRSRFKNFFNKIGLGKVVYGFIGVKQLWNPPMSSCDLYIDDWKPIHFDNLLFAAFMVNQYEGGGFRFCPDAQNQDGLLDICLIHGRTKFSGLKLLPPALKGKHITAKGVETFRGKNITIKTSKPLWVHTDGEILGQYQELSLTCQQGVLHYV